MRNLGLLPQRKEYDLHGFKPGELNAHFAGISVSPLENIDEAMDIIQSASEEGFFFKPINLTDVILTISHFSSQTRGADGIPQKIIVKALPAIGGYSSIPPLFLFRSGYLLEFLETSTCNCT